MVRPDAVSGIPGCQPVTRVAAVARDCRPQEPLPGFGRPDALTGGDSGQHAEGRWIADGAEDEDRDGRATVAVAFGP